MANPRTRKERIDYLTDRAIKFFDFYGVQCAVVDADVIQGAHQAAMGVAWASAKRDIASGGGVDEPI